MIYCAECKKEIEIEDIRYEKGDPFVGESDDAEFTCCHGEDVWYIPDYYEEGEFETFREHYTEEEIKKRFPEIERVDVWDAIEILK